MFGIEDLRKVSIFTELTDQQLRLIQGIVTIKQYDKGSFIFSEGERGDAVCFLLSGLVKIRTGVADGREKILHFMQAGQVFGEVVLFDGGPYPATAEVVEAADIGILRNQDLYRLLKEHSDLAISLLTLLARRLKMTQRQVRDLALKDAYTRVAELIIGLANECDDLREDGLHIHLRMTREEMANMTGTTRETLTRMLGELRRQKLVKVIRNGLIVPDLEALKDSVE